MLRRNTGRNTVYYVQGREPEYCDDCGKVVGYYDPSLPEGEKIIITDPCYCWRLP